MTTRIQRHEEPDLVITSQQKDGGELVTLTLGDEGPPIVLEAREARTLGFYLIGLTDKRES